MTIDSADATHRIENVSDEGKGQEAVRFLRSFGQQEA